MKVDSRFRLDFCRRPDFHHKTMWLSILDCGQWGNDTIQAGCAVQPLGPSVFP